MAIDVGVEVPLGRLAVYGPDGLGRARADRQVDAERRQPEAMLGVQHEDGPGGTEGDVEREDGQDEGADRGVVHHL